MLERLIYDVLVDGITQLTADPKKLVKFFTEQKKLSSTEAAAIKTYYLAHPPTVIHQYPRTEESTFPLYAIVLDSEQEQTKFLGDTAGEFNIDAAVEFGDPSLLGADVLTSLYRSRYSILVIDEKPDTTIYNYELAKYFLVKKRPVFKAEGILDMAISGADMAPDPRYLPAFLFVRRLTVEFLAEQSVVGDATTDGMVRSIDGVFIQGGSTSDIGDVEANVTVYTESD